MAALALACTFALLGLALQDPTARLGNPTVYSIGFFGLTWVFSEAVLASLFMLVRSQKQVFWGTWAYHLLVVAAGLVVLVYLAAHGIIGHRFWTCEPGGCLVNPAVPSAVLPEPNRESNSPN